MFCNGQLIGNCLACVCLLCMSFAIAIDAQGPVATALFLGDPALFNTTREDCVWRRGNDRDQCPDPDVTMTLFPPKKIHAKTKVKSSKSNNFLLTVITYITFTYKLHTHTQCASK